MVDIIKAAQFRTHMHKYCLASLIVSYCKGECGFAGVWITGRSTKGKKLKPVVVLTLGDEVRASLENPEGVEMLVLGVCTLSSHHHTSAYGKKP